MAGTRTSLGGWGVKRVLPHGLLYALERGSTTTVRLQGGTRHWHRHGCAGEHLIARTGWGQGLRTWMTAAFTSSLSVSTLDQPGSVWRCTDGCARVFWFKVLRVALYTAREDNRSQQPVIEFRIKLRFSVGVCCTLDSDPSQGRG